MVTGQVSSAVFFFTLLQLFLSSAAAEGTVISGHKLCANIFTAGFDFNGVALVRGHIWLAIAEQIYQIPPGYLNTDSQTRWDFSKGGQQPIRHLGKWSDLWSFSEPSPVGARLQQMIVYINQNLAENDPKKVIAHLILQTNGKLSQKVVRISEGKGDNGQGEPLGPYGLVTDAAGRNAHFIYPIKNWGKNETDLGCRVLFSDRLSDEYIPTTTAFKWSKTGYDPTYHDMFLLVDGKIKLDSRKDRQKLLLAALPVFGFLLHNKIHLWAISQRKVFIFKPAGRGSSVPYEELTLEQYFGCSAASTTSFASSAHEGGHHAFWIITGLIVIIAVSAGAFYFMAKKNKATAGKVKNIRTKGKGKGKATKGGQTLPKVKDPFPVENSYASIQTNAVSVEASSRQHSKGFKMMNYSSSNTTSKK